TVLASGYADRLADGDADALQPRLALGPGEALRVVADVRGAVQHAEAHRGEDTGRAEPAPEKADARVVRLPVARAARGGCAPFRRVVPLERDADHRGGAALPSARVVRGQAHPRRRLRNRALDGRAAR